jgi:hypothetical protein
MEDATTTVLISFSFIIKKSIFEKFAMNIDNFQKRQVFSPNTAK